MTNKKSSFFKKLNVFNKKKHSESKTGVLPEFGGKAPGNEYIEKIFRLPLNEGKCKLNVAALNGNVIITGYTWDMVCAKIMYKPKSSDAAIVLAADESGKYTLEYNKDDFDSVWAEIHVPARFFRDMKLKAAQGKIIASGFSTGNLALSCCGCELININAANFRLETNKKNVYLQNLTAIHAKVSLSNGQFHALGLDIKELIFKAVKCPVAIISKFDRHQEYKWDFNVKDAKFNITMSPGTDIAYYVLAESKVSGVKMALKNMDVLMGGHNFIEAKSKNYEGALKKAHLNIAAVRSPVSVH